MNDKKKARDKSNGETTDPVEDSRVQEVKAPREPAVIPSRFEVVSSAERSYWIPEPGELLQGVVLRREQDRNDPKRHVYTFRLTAPVTAYQGPTDDRAEVELKPGDLLHVDERAGIAILQAYIGSEVVVRTDELSKTKKGQDYWRFTVGIERTALQRANERAASDRQNKDIPF